MTDIPTYQYDCPNGHEVGADHPIDKCPAYVRGEPCNGELKRFGPGSRSKPRAMVDA
jgi:predicted nucleic acid-binding Zn ribbon protein